MSTRLFVGNLAFKLEDRELRDAFAPFAVVSAEVLHDKFTGRSRGFGFVELESEDAAARAIAELNGRELQGRPIRIERATGSGPHTSNGHNRRGDERN